MSWALFKGCGVSGLESYVVVENTAWLGP
jgi:hypothetical protein